MEDKITEATNDMRNKKKQRLTTEIIFNLITKINASVDQGRLMESFESVKANVFFNIPKGKRESYFLANENNDSWRNKSPIKINTLTFPKMKSPSTPDKLSIIENSMLTWKKATTK